MSYNGSGTFQINTSGQPVVTGTVISSSAFNALTADLATGLSTAITKDGQTATTVRIPFAQGINSSLATDTTSGSTGSIFTAGGVGIAKALYVGTNATVVGTLGVTGAATFSATPIFSALTASSAVATDASKNLVSVTNTGTGNNVLATSPTLVTPALGTPSALVLTNATGLTQSGLAANVVGNGPTFSAYPSGTFTISASTFTIVPCNTEEFDTNSNFNNTGSTVGSNPAYSFLPTVAGYYQINGAWSLGSATTFTRSLSAIYKNGTLIKQGLDNNGAAATGSNVAAIVYLNGTTDYVGFYIFEAGTGTITINAGPSSTYFQAAMIRSA